MIVVKCDRCGKTYRVNGTTPSHIELTMGTSHSACNAESIDLCEKCTKDFRRFLSAKTVIENCTDAQR